MKIIKGLNNIRQYLDTPVASYTHTANKEVAVSAVDIDTGVFTSTAHGLANGNQIYPIINLDAGMIYPINVYPTGLTMAIYTGYYVVGKTDDTFQISATSGGAAITFTANVNMDLTKWHFENSNGAAVNLTNIPSLKKCKLVIRGRSLATEQFKYFIPNTTTLSQEWIAEGTKSYDYPVTSSIAGDVHINAEVIFDYSGISTIKLTGFSIKSNNATTNIGTVINKTIASPKYRSGLITSIYVYNAWLANGTVLEVYRI